MVNFLHTLSYYAKKIIRYILYFVGGIFKRLFNPKEFFTVMIIPHAPVKSVKSVKFPRWAITSFVILNFIMFTVVCVFGVSYYWLNINLENKKAEYSSLQAIKEHNDKQLSEYKANEQEIWEKVQVLKDLEKKLRDIIDTKSDKPQANSNQTILASRGTGGVPIQPNVLAPTNQEGTSAGNPGDFNGLYTSVNGLVAQVDTDVKELDDAIKKAEAKIKAMRAIPSYLPVTGTITSLFENRRDPFGWGYEFHTGIDIANDYGTPIVASADGVVTTAGYDGGYGKLVKINHGNGYESLYGHNSRIAVDVGDRVTRGQVIAYMGSTGRSTGNHCHFEVRLNGTPINPYKVK